MLLCCKIWDILSTYTPTRDLDELTKMIILLRVGTPHNVLSNIERSDAWKNWTLRQSS